MDGKLSYIEEILCHNYYIDGKNERKLIMKSALDKILIFNVCFK